MALYQPIRTWLVALYIQVIVKSVGESVDSIIKVGVRAFVRAFPLLGEAFLGLAASVVHPQQLLPSFKVA